MIPDAGTIDFTPATPKNIDDFITRWSDAGGSERANYQLFLTELCALLSLTQPDPAGDDTVNNAYVFERRLHVCAFIERPARGSPKSNQNVFLWRQGLVNDKHRERSN